MGFLQPHVGHGRGDGETRLKGAGKAVTVISLVQAEAALAAAAAENAPVTLLSAPDAAANVGPGWFDAVVTLARNAYPNAQATAVLDCGDAPGHALAALRHGFKIVRYAGRNQAEIEEIARRFGARVLAERPPALDLEAIATVGDDLETACRKWLGEEKRKPKPKRWN
jgi:hypothetical protein